MIPRGYKIVWVDGDGRFISSMIDVPKAVVEYKIGKWAKPKKGNGPLGVFSTFEYAELFLKKMRGYSRDFKVFPCEYEPSIKNRQFFYRIDGELYYMYGFPPGTQFAKRVKIHE